MNKRNQKRNLRSSKGQGLLEGVAGLVIITIGVVAAVLLLINVGISSFYKERLGFVTQQVAAYASKHLTSDSLESNSKNLAEALLKENGLPQTAQFEVKKVSVDNRDAAKVTLTVAGLSLVGNGDILPKAIALSDSATAVDPNAGGGNPGNGKIALLIDGDSGSRGNSHLLYLEGREVDIPKGPGRPLLFRDAVKDLSTLTIQPNGRLPGNNQGANDLPVRIGYKASKED